MLEAAYIVYMRQGLTHAAVHVEWQAQLPMLYQQRSAVIATNGVSLCCLNVCMKGACRVGDLLHMSVTMLSAAVQCFDALCGFV